MGLCGSRMLDVGKGVGRSVIGAFVGSKEGEGLLDGSRVGFSVGDLEGGTVGTLVPVVGMEDVVGARVGDWVSKEE